MSAGAARAAAWLAAWDVQGPHRTASPGDAAGAAWLAGESVALGLAPAFEEFALDRLDPVSCHLELAGERIAGVPVFDAPGTDADGISGRLGPISSDAAIIAAELTPQAVYSGECERLRRNTTARALVIVCAGTQPGMGLLNAEHFRAPYGAPAVHIASETGPEVLQAAARGTSARLVSVSKKVPAQAGNVVVAVPGCDAARPPIVVMTPRSSWWQSTAERGGGLVCWLETLRALIAEPPAGDVVFTANSGHELGHLGFDDFVARRPGWAAGGATWVHYGANLGAVGGALSVVSTGEDLRQLAAAELRRAAQPPDRVPLDPAQPSGETRDIHRAGGRYLTLVGTNPWFHLPQDRLPHAVDIAAAARIAEAAARIVIALTR
jgi:hypothetical protein